VQEDGKLEMRINDKGTDDNDGELTVVILANGAVRSAQASMDSPSSMSQSSRD
jgi:hypothetical protein